MISPQLARAARGGRSELRSIHPARPPVSFVERKGVNAVRNELTGLLGIAGLYDLDRLDLSATTTIDAKAQKSAAAFIEQLADPGFITARGLDGYRLLDRGDPSKVVYSVIVHERTDRGNLVRVQTDNLDAPFNLNESARLELGSTAKLRTLASYLEVIAELFDTFSGQDSDSLRAIAPSQNHAMALWVRGQLLAHPTISLGELLRRSLLRVYSANPRERFVTGGGVQTFSNFDSTYDQQSIAVSEAFQQSVNLVFVRMMRDIVNHYVYREPGSAAHVLEETDSPLRTEYLQRFADREGIQFIDQFRRKFRERDSDDILQALVQDRRLSPQRTAWVYRSVVAKPSTGEFGALLRASQPNLGLTAGAIQDLYDRADPASLGLADLGYLASVHPLEIWVARYLMENPEATREEIVGKSAQARQDVYRWLFRTSRSGAQDQRIRFLLEVEAFTKIHEGWQALGYPFTNIVPSLGTAIGSSGDRPSALGDLVGVIVNDGVRMRTHNVQELHFAVGTPFDSRMVRKGSLRERVMPAEVAHVLREAMISVVEEGTARRMNGVLRGPDGQPLKVGGKTGTGDNRYRTFGPGGTLVESRSVNRTSTLVFFVEDRLYGVVTAYVPGAAADDYWFTSALPAQILRELAPVLRGLLGEDPMTGLEVPVLSDSLRREEGAASDLLTGAEVEDGSSTEPTGLP